MGEKRLYGCSCLSWCDKVSSAPPRRARTPAPPQDRSPYLLARSKPDCTVGTRPLRHKRHRNLSGTCLSPSPGSQASNRRWCVLPGSGAAPGTYCRREARGRYPQGRRADPFPRPFTPQTCQLLSQKSGNKEELIPGFKCIF